MARYVPIRLPRKGDCFWRVLTWIAGVLLGIGFSVVVWTVTGKADSEWVIIAISGAGIVVSWGFSWLMSGGLPPIARFRIKNQSDGRRVKRSGARVEPVGGEHAAEHDPHLVPVGQGTPNAAAYDVEPAEGPVERVTGSVVLEDDITYEVPVEISPPAESFDGGEITVREDKVEFEASFVVATGIVVVKQNSVPIP